MTTTVYQYRMYCNTEQTYTYSWGTAPPTLCPNDHSDRTNINNITIIDTITPTQATVTGTVFAKDYSPEEGWYQSTSVHVPIPEGEPDSITTYDWAVPFDMYIWTASLSQPPDSNGDVFTYAIIPDTTIGVTVQESHIGDTSINIGVGAVGFYYLTKGTEISLTDGNNTQYVGKVTSHDTTTGIVTFTDALLYDFPAYTYMRFTNYPIRDHIMDYQGDRMFFAYKGLKAKKVPAYYPMRIVYKNKSGNAKNIYFQMEYYMV